MLNEKSEAEQILSGNRIDKKNTYRTTLLLAKYYLQSGKTMLETRELIFAWGKEYGVYIAHNLTRMISALIHNGMDPLADNIKININKQDIENILKRFSTYNEQLLAFAFLVYAKKNADHKGHFIISMVGLSLWTGIHKNNIYSRYLKKSLFAMEYLEKIESGNNDMQLLKIVNQEKIVSKNSVFKILVPFKNNKSKNSIIFTDTNIREEFDAILKHFYN